MRKRLYFTVLMSALLLAICGCNKKDSQTPATPTGGVTGEETAQANNETGDNKTGDNKTGDDKTGDDKTGSNVTGNNGEEGNNMGNEQTKETDETTRKPNEPDGTTPFVPENPSEMPQTDDDGTESKVGGTSYEEAASSEWYQEMLKKAQLNLGNNKRLKAVIEKARAGEEITVATIGGSITEGAGAKKYNECYAYQFYDHFRNEYGKDDGSNVKFVNAGVGGTPSPFGLLRYGREVVSRVEDADGLPDIVVVEFAVNDYGEPTKHHCYESLVKQILMQPNEPVVILLFCVFPSEFTLQKELKPIGDAYDLMMVSIHDSAFAYVGDKWTNDEFFFDIYHPTTLGHKVMADCLIETVKAAESQPEAESDINLDIPAVFGTDYVGLKTIYKTDYEDDISLDFGGFTLDDTKAYSNYPIGRVCGENFHHGSDCGKEPLTFETSCKNLLIAYRAVNDSSFGSIDVYVDGVLVKTIKGNTGSWGQSVPDLIFADNEAAVHKIEIKMSEGDEKKKFTITCIGYTP